MKSNKFINNKFGFLGEYFFKELQEVGSIVKLKAQTTIIRKGDDIEYIFFLIKGAIKVYTFNEGREMIHYYTDANESSLLTISSLFKYCVSQIYAVTEKDSEILIIPVSVIQQWIVKYPKINSIFFHEYANKFLYMTEILNDVYFKKLDVRVLDYIKKQICITKKNPINLKHRDIADKLGTSREVVSRILKKIENRGEIFRNREGIKVLVSLDSEH